MKIKVGDVEFDLHKSVERISVVDLICPRRGWYAYREPISDIIKGVDEMMVAGMLTHDALLSQVKDKCRIEVPIEIEVCGKKRRFRADVVCDDYIIEIKKKYGKTTAPLYIWQLKVYMALTSTKRGYIVSVEDGYVKEVTATDEELRYIKETFIQNLEKAICSDEMPERKMGKWCNLCRFRNVCLNGRLL